MLLAFEEEVGVREPAGFERVDDDLRLGGKDDLVVGALQDEHGGGDLVDEVDR